jgi:hypothetical protein
MVLERALNVELDQLAQVIQARLLTAPKVHVNTPRAGPSIHSADPQYFLLCAQSGAIPIPPLGCTLVFQRDLNVKIGSHR